MKKSTILMIIITLTTVVSINFIYHPAEQDEFADIRNISIAEVRAKLGSSDSLLFLDVRRQEEYSGPLGHIPGAILIPLSELEDRISELEKYRDREIIVYCRSGNRSRYASRILTENDFEAYNMLGGMIEWNEQQ
jgi:rhodanese-related sulfurtransferase